MKKKALFSTCCAIIILVSCSTPKKVANNYYSHQTECVSVELDGTQIVNAWSNTGETYAAIEQAKRNAVNDVLFKGLIPGKNDCNVQPILPGANTKANHEEYFNKFFANGGPYRNYATVKDPNLEFQYGNEKDPEKIKKMINSGFVIKINRTDLKQKMIADGILK